MTLGPCPCNRTGWIQFGEPAQSFTYSLPPLRGVAHCRSLDKVEVDYGGYEGRTTKEISAELGRPWSLWRDGTVPGDSPGETLAQVAERVDRVLAEVRPLLDDGDVALVAHGHVLRILTARWLRLGPESGALFPLETGRYGLLGYEHDWSALTGWNTGCP